MSDLRARLARELPEGVVSALPDEEALRAWIGSAPPELTDALAGSDPADAERIAAILLEVGADATDALVRAESKAARGTRKVLRRAAHRLRSLGVAVEWTRPGRRGRLDPAPVDEGAALVGPIGHRGERLMVLLEPRPAGAIVLRAVVSDVEGVLRVDRSTSSRRAARAAIRALRERKEARLVPAEAAGVWELLRRAARIAIRESGAGRIAVQELLAHEGSSGETPGERVRARLGQRPMPPSLIDTELRRRIETGRIAPWVLEGANVQEEADRLRDVSESPIVLPGVQGRARSTQARAEAAERLLDRPVRERLATRLDETAFLLDREGDTDGARACLGVADRIRSDLPAARVEFLVWVLEATLRSVAPDRERESGRLILPHRS